MDKAYGDMGTCSVWSHTHTHRLDFMDSWLSFTNLTYNVTITICHVYLIMEKSANHFPILRFRLSSCGSRMCRSVNLETFWGSSAIFHTNGDLYLLSSYLVSFLLGSEVTNAELITGTIPIDESRENHVPWFVFCIRSSST